jgi:Zn-dependent protease
MLTLLPEVTLQQLLLRLLAYLAVVAVYGFVVTWLVRRAGDEGPTHDGRLTANPLVHLDVVALFAAIFFRVGWIKPLDVDATAFRSPRMGAAMVVLVSSLAMAGFAGACLFLRPLALALLGGGPSFAASLLLDITSEVAATAAVLNLLPIPPLVGGLWWAFVWPGGADWARLPRARHVGTLVIVAALLSGYATPPVRAAAAGLRRALGF